MIYAKKFVFIHVPKTGGSSVAATIGGDYGAYLKHTPLFEIERGHRFVFGFVRNPWARMVSHYRFHCQKPQLPGDNYDRAETIRMGFKAWLMENKFYLKQDKTTDLPPMQRRPQLWWLEGADFIGRFENIENDFKRAAALAGVWPVAALGHINATKGGDWRDEYDAESLAFVAEHFAPDIDRFKYKCE